MVKLNRRGFLGGLAALGATVGLTRSIPVVEAEAIAAPTFPSPSSPPIDTDHVAGLQFESPTALIDALNSGRDVSIGFFRVSEAAEIPRTQLQSGSQPIRVYKFGRGIDVSYDSIRRVPLDEIARDIQAMAIQNEMDKMAAIEASRLNFDPYYSRMDEACLRNFNEDASNIVAFPKNRAQRRADAKAMRRGRRRG